MAVSAAEMCIESSGIVAMLKRLYDTGEPQLLEDWLDAKIKPDSTR